MGVRDPHASSGNREEAQGEVLVVAFDLRVGPGLAGLARLVHYLDVGGALVPEVAGFEAVLAGLRDRSPDDDALLAATFPVLDALYQHFATSEIKNRT